ncbi:MAG: diacylglycerol kinase family protein [Bacillota bacterium]|nr:diacylglycerol kinase family protein [Bacillota bacterium]
MKNKNILMSFLNAFNGIIIAVKSERNIKIHIVCACLVFILSLHYKISRTEFAIIFLTISLVIVAEFINTAIEAVVDLVTSAYSQKARIAKDVAAGAVWISAFFAVIVGFIIFFDRVKDELIKLLF